MKKKIKYKIFIPFIIIFIVFALLISIVSSIHHENNQQILKEDYLQSIEKCDNLKKEDAIEEEFEWCQKALESDLTEFETNAYDAYDIFTVDCLQNYLNEFVLIAIIIAGSSYYITKYLRNRIILNDITREKYKKIVKNLFFSAWKYALIVPIMLFIIYFIIFLKVDNFSFSEGIADTSGFVGTIFENNLIFLFFTIFLKSFILSMVYININLIISRKEHNYIFSIIKTYLFIVGLEILFETVIRIFINKLGTFEYGILFNIINIYTYPYVEKGLAQIFILFGILLISFVPLLLVYRNKEQLIIDIEKNDNKEEV